ncbi:MAG: family 2 glycosyl transferase [Clostridium sp.]
MSSGKYIKIALGILAIIFFVMAFCYTSIFQGKNKRTGELSVISKVKGKEIILNTPGGEKPIFINGVNIGAGKPGYFPNEFGVTKEEYLKWFGQIKDMNANVIRVYTILSPEFYEAFYEFNNGRKDPLYLIHGVWVNENHVEETMNGYDRKIRGEFLRDAKAIIDLIHGNKYIPINNEYSNGRYSYDISKYVLGYIFGIEWDGGFVEGTDLFNEDKTSYKGEYLSSKNGASPFEVLLAEVGDYAIKYETEEYGNQRVIAFSNWPTTDPLDHPYEPEQFNSISNVDVENIVPTKNYKAGMFASYHVYPYYPDFLNLDPVLNGYRDEKGRKNSYRAYLNSIVDHHSMPVVISEFGVPTSRGIAHIDESRGYNHGHISEVQQAEATEDLYGDIVNSGSAGAIIFSWQDEWFKKSWNVMDGVDLERSAYWHNAQASEQNYGILGFEPAKEEDISYPDGDVSEWKEDNIITSNNLASVSMKNDYEYIYIKVSKKGLDLNKDKIYIPIDVTPKSGSKSSSLLGLKFDRDVDFVVEINGYDKSRVYVHDYYNPLINDHSKYPEDEPLKGNYTKEVDKFNKIYLTIRHAITVGPTKDKYEPIHYETGKLTYGNGNINSPEYNSLSDFYVSGDNIEIRLPWQLLNFSDPSRRKVRGDFVKNYEAKDISVGGIYPSLIVKGNGEDIVLESKKYKWGKWSKPKYIERLKPVYYKMQQVFKDNDS